MTDTKTLKHTEEQGTPDQYSPDRLPPLGCCWSFQADWSPAGSVDTPMSWEAHETKSARACARRAARETDIVGSVHVPVSEVQCSGRISPGVSQLCQGGDGVHPPLPLLPLSLFYFLPLLQETTHSDQAF